MDSLCVHRRPEKDLKPLAKKVVSLKDDHGMTFESIGKRLGVGRSYANYLYNWMKTGKRKMRDNSRKPKK